MVFNYVIWNARPQIIDLSSFELRYYSVFFALGFIIGYYLLLRFLKREGYPPELLDKLTIYVVLGTILGARLGHCLFYEFDYYSKHPLEMILPWRGTPGKDFEFTGYQGLASHGGAIGILIGIWLFVRKTKVSYLWTLDRLAIVVALAACMIRMGNLMNSEIYGVATGSNYGFVYAHDFTRFLTRNDADGLIEKVTYKKAIPDTLTIQGAVPIIATIRFSSRLKEVVKVNAFAESRLKLVLTDRKYQDNIIHNNPGALDYTIEKKHRNYEIKAVVYGIPRHPSQIYEAGAYLFIFVLLLYLYYLRGASPRNGFYLGIFLVLVFAARLLIEFVKEDQEAFESGMVLNMGQLLSIPFILVGVVLLINASRKPIVPPSV